MFLLGFRRKFTALTLCKSIESAIQWFQIHHRITFATIQNPAVYLSGARVSIFSTLVPRLYKLQPSFSERVIVDGHGCHTALHFGVKANVNQDKVPTLYWLPKLHKNPINRIYC